MAPYRRKHFVDKVVVGLRRIVKVPWDFEINYSMNGKTWKKVPANVQIKSK